MAPELAERLRPTRLQALAGLLELVSRTMGLEGGLTQSGSRQMTAQCHSMCEGLALLDLRGGLLPDRAEQVWRDGMAALIAGMRMRGPRHRLAPTWAAA